MENIGKVDSIDVSSSEAQAELAALREQIRLLSERAIVAEELRVDSIRTAAENARRLVAFEQRDRRQRERREQVAIGELRGRSTAGDSDERPPGLVDSRDNSPTRTAQTPSAARPLTEEDLRARGSDTVESKDMLQIFDEDDAMRTLAASAVATPAAHEPSASDQQRFWDQGRMTGMDALRDSKLATVLESDDPQVGEAEWRLEARKAVIIARLAAERQQLEQDQSQDHDRDVETAKALDSLEREAQAFERRQAAQREALLLKNDSAKDFLAERARQAGGKLPGFDNLREEWEQLEKLKDNLDGGAERYAGGNRQQSGRPSDTSTGSVPKKLLTSTFKKVEEGEAFQDKAFETDRMQLNAAVYKMSGGQISGAVHKSNSQRETMLVQNAVMAAGESQRRRLESGDPIAGVVHTASIFKHAEIGLAGVNLLSIKELIEHIIQFSYGQGAKTVYPWRIFSPPATKTLLERHAVFTSSSQKKLEYGLDMNMPTPSMEVALYDSIENFQETIRWSFAPRNPSEYEAFLLMTMKAVERKHNIVGTGKGGRLGYADITPWLRMMREKLEMTAQFLDQYPQESHITVNGKAVQCSNFPGNKPNKALGLKGIPAIILSGVGFPEFSERDTSGPTEFQNLNSLKLAIETMLEATKGSITSGNERSTAFYVGRCLSLIKTWSVVRSVVQPLESTFSHNAKDPLGIEAGGSNDAVSSKPPPRSALDPQRAVSTWLSRDEYNKRKASAMAGADMSSTQVALPRPRYNPKQQMLQALQSAGYEPTEQQLIQFLHGLDMQQERDGEDQGAFNFAGTQQALAEAGIGMDVMRLVDHGNRGEMYNIDDVIADDEYTRGAVLGDHTTTSWQSNWQDERQAEYQLQALETRGQAQQDRGNAALGQHRYGDGRALGRPPGGHDERGQRNNSYQDQRNQGGGRGMGERRPEGQLVSTTPARRAQWSEAERKAYFKTQPCHGFMDGTCTKSAADCIYSHDDKLIAARYASIHGHMSKKAAATPLTKTVSVLKRGGGEQSRAVSWDRDYESDVAQLNDDYDMRLAQLRSMSNASAEPRGSKMLQQLEVERRGRLQIANVEAEEYGGDSSAYSSADDA